MSHLMLLQLIAVPRTAFSALRVNKAARGQPPLLFVALQPSPVGGLQATVRLKIRVSLLEHAAACGGIRCNAKLVHIPMSC
jgi:hypothetical protein